MIRDRYPDEGPRLLAHELDVSLASLKRKAQDLGVRMKPDVLRAVRAQSGFCRR